MTSSRTRGARDAAAAAAAVLALALAAGGCGTGGGDGDGGGQRAPGTPPAPVATGTGPYPPPSGPGEAAPVLPGEGTPGPRGTPEGGVPRPADIDRTDADAVGRAVLTVLWTFDTAVDRRPHDAGLRAADAGWLTDAYADRLRAHRPRSVPGAQWQEWAGHRARTTVALKKTEDAAKPADTGTEAWRQWTVTATPHGREGWTGKPTTVVAYVRLTRPAAGRVWQVADVTVR
ncbi:hypothetical protein V1L54_16495 [Streptomyces sp. TRM 70361]|uniref:hypothetical protein n=1 Tax=Streptomyces sp. TRM 70361 TaxID=3116553 RepID=UPI002E7B904F|nr:hypothetical protein [Streptomyces sp. TRM 70361]MEE1940984.1 hypothetical protein [Streptomyces sp. TRM 70361]